MSKPENTNEAACGGSDLTAVLALARRGKTMATSTENKADYWFWQAMSNKADAERWRWLTTNCDGDAQDDFTRWLAGTVASKADIDAKVDAAMAAPNA